MNISNWNQKQISNFSDKFALILQGGYKNDFLGLEFEPLEPGRPKIKGEDVVYSIYGITDRYSKWWDLAAIVFLILAYRVIFFLVVKFKERFSPSLRKFYTSAVVLRLKRRPSFFQKSPVTNSRQMVEQ